MTYTDGTEPAWDQEGTLLGDGTRVESFDHGEIIEIADEVAWAILDAKWDNGNWRTESLPGQAFEFPKSGEYKGRSLEVTITGQCVRNIYIELPVDEDADPADFEEPEETEQIERTVSLIIEERVPERLGVTLEMARERSPEEFEKWLQDYAMSEQDLYKPGRITVKDVVVYTFDTDGDYGITFFNLIEGDDGSDAWRSDIGFVYKSTEDDDGDDDELDSKDILLSEVKFTDADIDNLMAAAVILGAPAETLDFLYLHQGILPESMLDRPDIDQ